MPTLESVRKLVQERQKAAEADLEKNGNPNEERFEQIKSALDDCEKKGYLPGERLGRVARAMAAVRGDREAAICLIADSYKDKQTAEELAKSMEAGTPESGGFLVRESWSDELIPLLRPMALLPKLGFRNVPNPTGTIHFARVASGSAAYWKPPEGGKILASQPTLGRLTLRDKTLTSLVAVSNKLLRVASRDADMFITMDMLASLGVALDTASWYGAGDEWEPAGLLTRVINEAGVNKIDVNAIPDPDTVIDFLVAHMEANASMVNLKWAMGPRLWGLFMKMTDGVGYRLFREEMRNGTLMGIPFEVGSQITTDTAAQYKPTSLVLGDWNEYLVGIVRNLEVAHSDEAAYYDKDGNLVAAFGTDESVTRVIFSGDMGPRQLASFTMSNNVRTSAT